MIHLTWIAKSAEVLIISSVKFIFAAPVSYINGFDYLQTLLITALGGIAGVLFFYYLTGWVIKREKIRLYFAKMASDDKSKFLSKEIKFIEKIRNKYGLIGIIILTPVFLSIPLGAILANKYYSTKKRIPLYLTISVVCWSLIMTTFCSCNSCGCLSSKARLLSIADFQHLGHSVCCLFPPLLLADFLANCLRWYTALLPHSHWCFMVDH